MTERSADQGKWWRKAFVTIPAIVAIGLLMGAVSNSGFGNDWYDPLDKPSFQPPGWAFGAAWTTLYILMGIALALILAAPSSSPVQTSPTWGPASATRSRSRTGSASSSTRPIASRSTTPSARRPSRSGCMSPAISIRAGCAASARSTHSFAR